MIRILIISILFSCTSIAKSGGFFNGPIINIGGDEFAGREIQKKIKELQAEEKRKLDETNVLDWSDISLILDEKTKDLKVINAILMRYKEDFRKVREQNDQDGQYTKVKVLEIFKNNIWQYKPSKYLSDLIRHLHSDYHEVRGMSRDEKIFHLKNKITQLKDQMIYLRDLCIRRKVTPWDVFVYLYHTDIRLAVHKHNQEYEKYRQVLEELDHGLE